MKRDEYGGYIEFERFHGKEFHGGALALNSGRHCLEYLIRARNIRKLCLPYFMCDCVSILCDKLGVKTEYYHIDANFHPLFDRALADDEWIYIVNYYGQLENALFQAYRAKYGRVIVDFAQAFFQTPPTDLDTLYTCRKFFGLSDGAYLYTDAALNEVLEQECSYNRMGFLLGRFEKTAQEFYREYAANNDFFETESLKKMSALTQNLLRGIDYAYIKDVRTENFSYLHDRLGRYNRLRLRIPTGAFMYPLYIKNGAELRKRLQTKKVYIPTLWPNVLDCCSASDLEYHLAQDILPLPVDQRYTTEDMRTICEMLMAEMGGN